MHILPSLNVGGVERYVIELSSMMNNNTVVVSSGGRLCEELKKNGVKHICINASTKNPFNMFRNVFKIEKLIKEHKIDIIHAHSRAPAWSAYYASKKSNTTFVTTYHARYNSKSWIKKKYNSVMARSAKVISISEFIKNHLMESYRNETWFDESRIRLVHCGVDCKKFSTTISEKKKIAAQKILDDLGIKNGKTIVLLPSRMTYWKGHTTTIEALSYLSPKQKSKIRVIFLDDFGRNTSYKKKVKGMIDFYAVGSIVSFIAYVPDIVPLFHVADVILSVSSDPEGFGLITAEAGASGKPVIAAEHGATPEIMLHEKTGWLVPPNDPKALADAMCKVIDMPKCELLKIGMDARQHISLNFSKEVFCSKIMEIYKECLQ